MDEENWGTGVDEKDTGTAVGEGIGGTPLRDQMRCWAMGAGCWVLAPPGGGVVNVFPKSV